MLLSTFLFNFIFQNEQTDVLLNVPNQPAKESNEESHIEVSASEVEVGAVTNYQMLFLKITFTILLTRFISDWACQLH